VISQTAEIHDEIHEILKQLRAALPSGQSAEDEPDESQMVVRVYMPVNVFSAMGGFSAPDDQDKLQEARVTLEQIIEAAQNLVAPDAWKTEGASIRPVGKYLFVRQTIAAHDQVSELLKKLGYQPLPANASALYPVKVGGGSSGPM
jgi:hypothetical protein